MLSSPCRRSSLPLNYEKQKQRWPLRNCDRKYPSWALSGLDTCRLTHHSQWVNDTFLNGLTIPNLMSHNKYSNRYGLVFSIFRKNTLLKLLPLRLIQLSRHPRSYSFGKIIAPRQRVIAINQTNWWPLDWGKWKPSPSCVNYESVSWNSKLR